MPVPTTMLYQLDIDAEDAQVGGLSMLGRRSIPLCSRNSVEDRTSRKCNGFQDFGLLAGIGLQAASIRGTSSLEGILVAEDGTLVSTSTTSRFCCDLVQASEDIVGRSVSSRPQVNPCTRMPLRRRRPGVRARLSEGFGRRPGV